MTNRSFKTPNMAKEVFVQTPLVMCQATTCSGWKKCPNGSRWELEANGGEKIRVCRMHANKAERTGEIYVRVKD